jgi:hypothetical protein
LAADEYAVNDVGGDDGTVFMESEPPRFRQDEEMEMSNEELDREEYYRGQEASGMEQPEAPPYVQDAYGRVADARYAYGMIHRS